MVRRRGGSIRVCIRIGRLHVGRVDAEGRGEREATAGRSSILRRRGCDIVTGQMLVVCFVLPFVS